MHSIKSEQSSAKKCRFAQQQQRVIINKHGVDVCDVCTSDTIKSNTTDSWYALANIRCIRKYPQYFPPIDATYSWMAWCTFDCRYLLCRTYEKISSPSRSALQSVSLQQAAQCNCKRNKNRWLWLLKYGQSLRANNWVAFVRLIKLPGRFIAPRNGDGAMTAWNKMTF